MRLFSYIVARDYGFAPNPFYGVCTLATCKPMIRLTADEDDWVIGTGARTKYNFSGRLIFAMKVEEIIDFDNYWSDPLYACKRPILNGSLKQVYGDNIYHNQGNQWIQEDSHHSFEDGRPNTNNIKRDTRVNRLLISRRFVYFGEEAPMVPNHFMPFIATGEYLCCQAQGHRILTEAIATSFVRWLDKNNKWGLQGLPLEFSRHTRVTVRKT